MEKATPDFIRIGNEFTSSVDAGHQFLALALRAEMSEIGAIHQLIYGNQLTRDSMIEWLNVTPGRCLSTGSDGAVKVAVIDWGEWAMDYPYNYAARSANPERTSWRLWA